jgi:hypothetical protein
MDLKKFFTDSGQYIGAGVAFQNSPQNLLYCIIALALINKIFVFIMRNHKLTDNDEFVDADGIPRKNNSTYRK